ncbi:MAG: tyrosine-type recombinase/integrase [Gammaproteobacteria bacterium]
MIASASLSRLMQRFFTDSLARQRDVSAHTLHSYRDSWRQLLRFVAGREGRTVARLGIEDVTASAILAFLDEIERRGASVGTRNCRLAAIRAFFAYAAGEEPALSDHCAAVLRIPRKRAARPVVTSLDGDEIEAILAQPDRCTLEGQRDHLLLAFLYNTGARIQEALNVCPAAIRFEPPATVKLLGKGRKERICPLWPETVALIRAFQRRQPRADQDPLFVNRYGERLTASGVRFKLSHYVSAATASTPSLARKRVSPHTFRHSTAVHLVAVGVDVTVIRDWLGHVSLDTTARYAQADLATKRRALERLHRPPTHSRHRWRQNTDLLAWLDAL